MTGVQSFTTSDVMSAGVTSVDDQGNTTGLSETLDESRAYAWESRQLCRQQGPSRTAANDEDVDGVGKLCREDVGIAGLVAI